MFNFGNFNPQQFAALAPPTGATNAPVTPSPLTFSAATKTGVQQFDPLINTNGQWSAAPIAPNPMDQYKKLGLDEAPGYEGYYGYDPHAEALGLVDGKVFYENFDPRLYTGNDRRESFLIQDWVDPNWAKENTTAYTDPTTGKSGFLIDPTLINDPNFATKSVDSYRNEADLNGGIMGALGPVGQGLLTLASIIPSPIQPFAAMASAGLNVASGVQNGNWGQAVGGALGFAPIGNAVMGGLNQYVGSGISAMSPELASALGSQGVSALTSGVASAGLAGLGGADLSQALTAGLMTGAGNYGSNYAVDQLKAAGITDPAILGAAKSGTGSLIKSGGNTDAALTSALTAGANNFAAPYIDSGVDWATNLFSGDGATADAATSSFDPQWQDSIYSQPYNGTADAGGTNMSGGYDDLFGDIDSYFQNDTPEDYLYYGIDNNPAYEDMFPYAPGQDQYVNGSEVDWSLFPDIDMSGGNYTDQFGSTIWDPLQDVIQWTGGIADTQRVATGNGIAGGARGKSTGTGAAGKTAATGSVLQQLMKQFLGEGGAEAANPYINAGTALLSYLASRQGAQNNADAAQGALNNLRSPAFSAALTPAAFASPGQGKTLGQVMMRAKGGGVGSGCSCGGLSAYVKGGSAGQADKIPAMLSDGEYVMDADIVSALGDGNNEAGAAALDRMRENVRKHKRAAPAHKIPPKAKKPEQYLKGAK